MSTTHNNRTQADWQALLAKSTLDARYIPQRELVLVNHGYETYAITADGAVHLSVFIEDENRLVEHDTWASEAFLDYLLSVTSRTR